MSENYYDILGIKKDATQTEIKKAYHKAAQKYHPDKKTGDEAKFKKANEAYEVLSDTAKRSQYDQFGTTGNAYTGGTNGNYGGYQQYSYGGGDGFGGFDFGNMEDVFSSFFGGSRSSQRKSKVTRGSDLEISILLSFSDSMLGCKKVFSSTHAQKCEECDGKGGEGSEICSNCKGTGRVTSVMQTPFGQVQQQTMCSECKGEGKTFKKTCSKCKGEGRVNKKTKIEIEIPAGVANGETLKFVGKGEAGRRGGSSGDLFVHVSVENSREFVRRGFDILSELQIPAFEALAGGEFKVKTFWEKMTIVVPELTPDGKILRLRNQGVRAKNGSQGDHLVTIRYVYPKKLSSKQKELLEQLK